jgi:septum site-determining protein MinC
MKVTQQATPSAFQLKGSVLTVSVLQILTFDYSALAIQLEELVKKNPNFFQHMPVVIDLQKIYSLDNDINFAEINSLLRKNNLVPVGVINANNKQIACATEVGLGILPSLKTTQPPRQAKKTENSKVITQPVRSGQQIYAKNSDLIVLSSVSNGAEILADGNIHVYGTLRGRAIAGASGDSSVRIFCHKLEAELVSIAGYYKLQEELAQVEHPISSQIYLEEEQLVISALG